MERATTATTATTATIRMTEYTQLRQITTKVGFSLCLGNDEDSVVLDGDDDALLACYSLFFLVDNDNMSAIIDSFM
jgi:hypothetical protein